MFGAVSGAERGLGGRGGHKYAAGILSGGSGKAFAGHGKYAVSYTHLDVYKRQPWLSLVLSAALGLLFGMLLGGLWFGYWIRQEGLQLTHLLLVVWVLANFFVLNVRWN